MDGWMMDRVCVCVLVEKDLIILHTNTISHTHTDSLPDLFQQYE